MANCLALLNSCTYKL